MEENLETLEADTDVAHVDTAEGEENQVDTSDTTSAALTLEEINSLTRRTYASLEEARKGIDNLARTVGKKEIQTPVADPQLVEKISTLEKQVKEATFYAEHPDLKPHKDVLSKFGDPEAALQDPVVQKVIEAVKAREESSEELKSNARIAQVSSDYQTEFQKAEASGDWSKVLEMKGLKPKV